VFAVCGILRCVIKQAVVAAPEGTIAARGLESPPDGR
jgi:hypothetical protein